MPWQECSVMDERLQFVARRLAGEAMAELCREFGISRKTGYKIFDHIWQQSGADKKGKGRRGARFAPDSPLEESGFEPSVPPCERVGLSGRNANASQATRMVSNASSM